MIAADAAMRVIRKRWLDVCSNPHVQNMVSCFEATAHLYVVGGWLRDVIHNDTWGTELSSKDIDIVFQGGSTPELLLGCDRTQFNGYTLQTGGIAWDCWRLEDTWTFKQGYFAPSVENFMNSLTFTVDAILFEPRSSQLLGNEALEDIPAKSLRLNCDVYLDKLGSLQAFRAAKMSEKYGYKATAHTKRILRDCLNEMELTKLLQREAQKANVSPEEFVAHWHARVLETIQC